MKEKILTLPTPYGGNLELYKNVWGKAGESLSIVILDLLFKFLGIILFSDTFLSTPEMINLKLLLLLNNSKRLNTSLNQKQKRLLNLF